MQVEFPWETPHARRIRALEMSIQCQAEHQVGNLIHYCQKDSGHHGDHIDSVGRRFTEFFSFLGRSTRAGPASR
jgi:hypothetical protein